MQHARMLITPTRPTRQPTRCNAIHRVATAAAVCCPCGLAGQAQRYRARSIECGGTRQPVAAAHACGCGSMKSRLRGSAPLGCVASNAFLQHTHAARASVRRERSRTGEAAARRAWQDKINRTRIGKAVQKREWGEPRTRAEHRLAGVP